MPNYVFELKRFLTATITRLAGSYLLIIMLMSISFSIVFYNASSHELGRQIPPPSSFGLQRSGDIPGGGPSIDSFFHDRIAQGRRTLLARLILLNVLALLGGSVFSYYLARRTLQPIEANMEAQSQFVSDASHELRTPLTALQTTNEVALRKPKLTAAETKELLTYNVAEVEKLKQLTTALLRLAKQDGDDLVRTKTSVQDIVTDALNAVVGLAVSKHITVEDTVGDMSVVVDKASITQAIVTVLDNAIKYSPAKTTIHLSAVAENNHAYIRIRDEGPGISSADAPHIFDRFYRADQSRNKQQVNGYGIGLALAQKIITQHQGTISVTSQLGQGATFTLSLPLA